MKLCLAMLLMVVLAASAEAQWLNHRTPNIPRTEDGRPDLAAPAPRMPDGKPDLSGVWQSQPRLSDVEAAGLLQPSAQRLVAQRAENFYKDRPSYQCRPSGPELTGGWRRIVHTATLITILNEDLTYRLIFMDGRGLESDPNPSWMGYSVGRWEGDTLVVESAGFNDKTWLTGRGWPHTEQLRMTERFRRPAFGQVQVDVTITDPGAYTKPWAASLMLALRPDTEMLEAVCESRQDHWVGTVSDGRRTAVKVSADLLAAFEGTYSGLWATNPRTVKVALRDGELRATIITNGVVTDENVLLVPQSATLFAGAGLEYEFVREGARTTHVIEHHVSGAYRFARQP